MYNDQKRQVEYWKKVEDVVDNIDCSIVFCYDERAWLDLHALEECDDPFNAFDWIVQHNIKGFLNKQYMEI